MLLMNEILWDAASVPSPDRSWVEDEGRKGKRRSECGWGQHTLLDPQPEEMKGASPQPAVSPPAAADACRAQKLE